MKSTFWAVALICGSAVVSGQSFEGAITGGASELSRATITPSISGVPGAGDSVKLDNGWNLGFRMTLNPYRIFGFELGYIYNRTHLLVGGADQGGMAIHQGYGDALIYATKEGSHIRPFGAAGINFSNFVLPGGSAQYGQGENKFGINYGAGVKVLIGGKWQVRFDIRQFNQGKPNFGIPNVHGRLLLTQYSVGFGIGL